MCAVVLYIWNDSYVVVVNCLFWTRTIKGDEGLKIDFQFYMLKSEI